MVTVTPGLRPGDVVELVVEKGVYRGQGLARHHGQVVFVRHVVPGEKVRARVEQAGRGFVEARLMEVLEPAAGRRTPPCPYVPRCGGCAHQEMTYDAQLTLKEAVLRESLGRSGITWADPIAVHASVEEAWRTRASFHLGSGPDGLRLGLFEEGTHRVVDVETCLQVSPAMNRAARALLAALKERPAVAALVHGIELAESGDGQQLVAALIVHGAATEATGAAALATEVPWLTGLGVATEERGHADFLLLSGKQYVRTSVLGLDLRAHVRSFFQGNRFLMEPLASAVLAAVPADGPMLDLYAGVGLFALLAAQKGARVRSAEISALAVADARANAETAGLRGVRLLEADVRTALDQWPVEEGETIVLDPPRSGAEGGVIEKIAARRPKGIVYVSCDPPTLGRDLKKLVGQGYRIDSLQAFDLFPDTFHVETVAVLSRN